MRRAAKIGCAGGLTLALLAALEGVGRLLHHTPTGAEARTAAFNREFYEPDPDLVVRLRPLLDTDYTTVRPDLAGRVTTNAEGFRGGAFAPADEDAVRIAVLGDSVSFGFGVDDAETWPHHLAGLLAADGRAVQVRNLAVPGYSTAQGRLLFERRVLDGEFAPHIVVFAFGFNDGYLRDQTDAQTRISERRRRETWLGRTRGWLAEHSAFCAWLWSGPPPAATAVRVPAAEVRANLAAVADGAARAGIELVLIDASLPHTFARGAVQAIATERDLPWLAFRSAFAAHRGIGAGGAWPDGGPLTVSVPTHGIAIPAAPAGQPTCALVLLDSSDQRPRWRLLPMNDAGTAGDDRAGDGVWSCRWDVGRGDRPEFGVWIPGFAAQLPEMADPTALLNGVHLQQPGPRSTPALRLAAPNACPWPELVLLPDPIHASPAGTRVMAAAVAAAVRGCRAWRSG